MTDTISGTNQRSASISPKKAVNSEKQQSSKTTESDIPIATKTGDSSVELSAKLKDEIASVGFDSKKVDHIKQSIEQGNYPLDDRKIADSFIPLEKLL
tara:strand:- start:275 stop:568 length:294 start_codon:yes stop_codon:yes gene_type:complete